MNHFSIETKSTTYQRAWLLNNISTFWLASLAELTYDARKKLLLKNAIFNLKNNELFVQLIHFLLQKL
jgi:hypothetical protein